MYTVPNYFWGGFFKIALCLSKPEENLVLHLGPSSSARGGPRFSDDGPA